MITSSARLRRSVVKTVPFYVALAGGRAPAFVYGGHVHGIPLFTYHVPGPSFEEDLGVLLRAGYRHGRGRRTGCIRERKAQAGRTNGRADFRRRRRIPGARVVPLLQRYGFRGIAFVVAGLVPERSEGGLAGWEELRAAVATGVLEVGAHSLYHHEVPISPDVVGFVGFRNRYRLHRQHADSATPQRDPHRGHANLSRPSEVYRRPRILS